MISYKRTQQWSGKTYNAAILKASDGCYTIYTPYEFEQNDREYKTLAGAKRWMEKHGWEEVEEATDEELVEDNMGPTLEQKLDEMAVAAVVTNKQVAELRAEYFATISRSDEFFANGDEATQVQLLEHARGIRHACEMLGIEL